MYQLNDLVVYHRNVCRIINKQKNSFTGELCYVLVPYDSVDESVLMRVPVSDRGGHLRKLLTRQQILELFEKSRSLETLEDKPANMKSVYVTLMKGDDVLDLIKIIKTSFLRNQDRLNNRKKLAGIDTEYLEKAEKCLFTEFSVVLEKSFEECRDEFLNTMLSA